METTKQLEIMIGEILFIIEEFEIGGITAFECIKQIKEKLNN